MVLPTKTEKSDHVSNTNMQLLIFRRLKSATLNGFRSSGDRTTYCEESDTLAAASCAQILLRRTLYRNRKNPRSTTSDRLVWRTLT